MYEVNDGESLSRLSIYELSRADGLLTIKVHEFLTESVYTYIAIPSINQAEALDIYIGTGATSEEALAHCLRKIKGTATVDLFPG